MVNDQHLLNVLNDLLDPIALKNWNEKTNKSMHNKKLSHLERKNKLPNEKSTANFLAFNIITGMKSVANAIHNRPIIRHIINPRIRCLRV
jgi:hypothetical protein